MSAGLSHHGQPRAAPAAMLPPADLALLLAAVALRLQAAAAQAPSGDQLTQVVLDAVQALQNLQQLVLALPWTLGAELDAEVEAAACLVHQL